MSLLLWVFTAQQLGAQSILSITDYEGVALPGAYVQSSDFPEGYVLISDRKGEVSIKESLFQAPNLRLKVSFVGMIDRTVRVDRGQSVSVRMELDMVQLEEAVVTGEYSRSHAEHAVHSIEVIGKEEIEAISASQVGDILQHSSQIQIKRDAVVGTGISIQGLDDRNVKVTIDEVPVIGRIDGKLDLGQLDVQNIDRIEIVKGPMAVSYGTDAIAGVINIITKNPDEKTTSAAARAYYSSEGQYDLHGSFSSSTERYRYSLRAGRRYFDGWSPSDATFSEPDPLADSRRDKLWNAKEQWLAGLNHSWLGAKRSLSHSLSFMQETLINRGLPITNHASETIIGLDEEYQTLRLDNSLRLKQDDFVGGALSALLSFNYFLRERSQLVTDLTDISQISNARDTTEYLSLNTRHTWSKELTDSLAFQVGMDASWESSTGERISGRPDILQAAGFISTEWRPFNGMLIRPGVRMGYHELFSMPVIPSIALRYRTALHTFRASYGIGFRAPAFKELYLAFFDSNHNVYGNESLVPEESKNLSLGHSYSRTSGKVKWSSALSVFHNHLEQMISLIQVANAEAGAVAPYSYFNLDRVNTQGLHISGELNTKFIGLDAGVTWTGKEQWEQEERIIPMDYSIQATSGLSMEHQVWAADLNIRFTYNGPQNTVILKDESVVRLYQDGYSMLDLSLGKKFGKEIKLQFGIRNILDVTNITISNGLGVHQGSRGASPLATGRNYFMSLSYNLNFKNKG